MKVVKAGFTSWKSTVVGALLGGLIYLQDGLANGLDFSDPKLGIGVAIAVLGFLSRDADKSSQDSGVR
jgi:hypothetical protein